MPDFVKPANLIGTFGVVRLWPGVDNAEVEVNARLKLAAHKLGLKCIEITADGMMLSSPKIPVTQADVDFVIHLHFETPKAYDLFSFAALWNPLQFYYDYMPGNYRKWSNNLLSHDDFLSCSSVAADDHVKRLIANLPERLPPHFTMYHSLAEPIIAPKLGGTKKIFYAGINHERLGKGRSRHQELLDMLDISGDLRIYGPDLFLGVRVWEGYKSYVGPLPFDGVSVVNEIAEAGIVLALSSEPHKDSELMSNRLFEGLAGGAIIIADENPFARRYFGDTLLYIDSSLPANEINSQVRRHLRWIRENPKEAQALAISAQAIFKQKFTLDRSLAAIYEGFEARKTALTAARTPAQTPPVNLMFMLPEFSDSLLNTHLHSLSCQTYPAITASLLIDEADYKLHQRRIDSIIEKSGARLTVAPIPFYKNYHQYKGNKARTLGSVLFNAVSKLPEGTLYCMIGAEETLFSEHVSNLVGTFIKNQDDDAKDRSTAVAATLLIKEERLNEPQRLRLKQLLTLFEIKAVEATGRFLLQKPADFEKYAIILPYLNQKSLPFLATEANCAYTYRVTTSIKTTPNDGNEQADFENQIIMDYLPAESWSYKLSGQPLLSHIDMRPSQLSLENMSAVNKNEIVKELFLSLPLSKRMKRFVFRTYKTFKRSK